MYACLLDARRTDLAAAFRTNCFDERMAASLIESAVAKKQRERPRRQTASMIALGRQHITSPASLDRRSRLPHRRNEGVRGATLLRRKACGKTETSGSSGSNNALDICEMAEGTSPDDNGHGLPDECDGVVATRSTRGMAALTAPLLIAGIVVHKRRERSDPCKFRLEDIACPTKWVYLP